MITKSQLQDGFKFTYGSEIYRLKDPNMDRGFYYVINEKDDETSHYVGNVEVIEDEYFTLYTYVMMNRVDVKVNYSDCYL
jgi:hypothetical protein